MANPLKLASDRVRLTLLKRKKRKLETKHQKVLDFQKYITDNPLWLYEEVKDPEVQKAVELRSDYETQIAIIETRKLRRLMEKWDIPMGRDWLSLYYTKEREELHLLFEDTRKKIESQIKAKRKESIEWWVTKVIVPVAGVITGLIGVIVALIALKYKK